MSVLTEEEKTRYEYDERGFKCPRCGNYASRVLYAYRNKSGGMRRERECKYCHHRFPTQEKMT